MIFVIVICFFVGVLVKWFNKKYLFIFGIVISVSLIGVYYLVLDVSVLLFICLIYGVGFGLVIIYFVMIVVEIILKECWGEGIGYFGVGEMIVVLVGFMIGIVVLEFYDFERFFFGGMFIFLLVVFMVVFVWRWFEVRDIVEKGMVKVKVLEKCVLFFLFFILLVGIVVFGIMFFFLFYVIEKGFWSVGMFFFLIVVVSFLICFIFGKIFDWFGVVGIFILVLIFLIVGFLILYIV